MRRRLEIAAVTSALLAGLALACVVFFCAHRDKVADQDDQAQIRAINAHMERLRATMKASQSAFEVFAFAPAMTSTSALAHQQSAQDMDEKRRVRNKWNKHVHGAAAAGALLCCLAMVMSHLMWKHLWNVDRCRQVLRARSVLAAAPRPPRVWRFVVPPLLFATGLALVSAAVVQQMAETNAARKQRNEFALYTAVALFALAFASQVISASFAQDASAVVLWARQARPRVPQKEESICKSVARQIENESIRP
jgi:hypothetical protein